MYAPAPSPPRAPRVRRSLALPAASAIAIVLGTTQVACARHHGGASRESGGFDYYLLSLSWSPAYCLESPTSGECNGPRAFGFIVHGLWPQNEHGWPENCDTSRVPEDVANRMLDLMPARGLIYHEWKAHGTCSGLSPDEYFRLVRTARATISLPPGFGAGTAPVEQQPAALTAAFLRANPRLSADSLVVSCSTGNVPRLREVRVCLTRDLAPRRCSADVLRGACRADTLLVPPVR